MYSKEELIGFQEIYDKIKNALVRYVYINNLFGKNTIEHIDFTESGIYIHYFNEYRGDWEKNSMFMNWEEFDKYMLTRALQIEEE